MKKRLVVLCTILLVSYGCLQAQTVIEGKITGLNGEPVGYASITIYKKATDSIIAYKMSGKDGQYSIRFTFAQNDVDICVRSMGYALVRETIVNKTQTKNLQLVEKIGDLKEIIIQNTAISKLGDTIKYLVSSFAKEQDRSIGDVLKRLPGIEVLSDGRVLYQGKPVSKYYINNLDLLGGSYNLANDNLQHKVVSQVEILENHQPVKALDSLFRTGNPALNIKLKNAYTFSGKASLGIGATPLLWDVNVTPMLFTPKYQTLSSYQSNNAGDDVSKQLKVLTIENLFEKFHQQKNKIDWLAVPSLSSPDFSEKRWLNNNVHLLTGNYLQKLNKDYELRLNVSYLNDYQQEKGASHTQYMMPTYIVNLSEEKHNHLFYNSLNAKLSLLRNEKKKYLQNDIEFQGNWDSRMGHIALDAQKVEQYLDNSFFRFSNKLKSLLPVGKQLLDFRSYMEYNKAPQSLKILPGQFTDLLNDSADYSSLMQRVHMQSFYTDNYIGFVKGVKKIALDTKIGWEVDYKQLRTGLATSEHTVLGQEYFNHLDWLHSRAYVHLATQLKKQNWRVDFSLPLSYHIYYLKDTSLQQINNIHKPTIEPSLSLNYNFMRHFELNMQAKYNHYFGAIDQLHYGYILKNYREIKRSNVPLPEKQSYYYAAGMRYSNIRRAIFAYLTYSYTHQWSNLLHKVAISPQGLTDRQAIEQRSAHNTHSVAMRFSTVLKPIASNISLLSSWNFSHSKQLMNNYLSDVHTHSATISGKIETDITDWLSMMYKTEWLWAVSFIQSVPSSPVTKQDNHALNIHMYLSNNQYFTIRSEYAHNNYGNKDNTSIFTDLLYRYTWKKKKIDLELKNVFDKTQFNSIMVDDYRYIATTYELRPRQILCRVKFSF